MKRNPIFVYNNIDTQNLVYANQLTVKQWNDIINKLTAQANANTTFLETWTRWFFGPIEYTTEDEYTDSLGTYDSYYDYLKAEFNRIDARITEEATRLDGRINEEKANREAQDVILSNRITTNANNIEKEKTERESSISNLNKDINQNIQSLKSDITDGVIPVGAIDANINPVSPEAPLLCNLKVNNKQFVLPNTTLNFLKDAVSGAHRLGALQIDGDVWNINNDIVELDLSNRHIEDAMQLSSITINGDTWNVVNMDDVNSVVLELLQYLRDNNYHKGEYLSYEELIEECPTGRRGYFAFVNTPTDQGDVMLMYVWDEDEFRWRETTSQQYVLSSVFNNELTNILNKINEKVSITDLNPLQLSVSKDVSSEGEFMHTLTIGDDTWKIPTPSETISNGIYTLSDTDSYTLTHISDTEITITLNKDNCYYKFDLSKIEFMTTVENASTTLIIKPHGPNTTCILYTNTLGDYKPLGLLSIYGLGGLIINTNTNVDPSYLNNTFNIEDTVIEFEGITLSEYIFRIVWNSALDCIIDISIFEL